MCLCGERTLMAELHGASGAMPGSKELFCTPEVPGYRAGYDPCTALLRRAWRTICAAQHAGAKRQPTSGFADAGAFMDDGKTEPARLFLYFSARGAHNFSDVCISMTRQVALS